MIRNCHPEKTISPWRLLTQDIAARSISGVTGLLTAEDESVSVVIGRGKESMTNVLLIEDDKETEPHDNVAVEVVQQLSDHVTPPADQSRSRRSVDPGRC